MVANCRRRKWLRREMAGSGCGKTKPICSSGGTEGGNLHGERKSQPQGRDCFVAALLAMTCVRRMRQDGLPSADTENGKCKNKANFERGQSDVNRCSGKEIGGKGVDWAGAKTKPICRPAETMGEWSRCPG
jgi:hypothetical protein